jgi:phenylacetate-CoA ligase
VLLRDATTLRDHFWRRRDLSGKLAAIRLTDAGVGDPPGGTALADWGPPVAELFPTGPSALLSIMADVASQAHWLAREQPDYLIVYPSNLAALIEQFSRRGDRPGRLREVRTVGELVTPELRAACRERWGVPLTDVYSSFELGNLALECPESGLYHVMAECVYIEILGPGNEPCRPGEIGRLVVTSLHNVATPLVRYEIGDHAEAGEPCPCGRGLPTLRRILGRSRNMLTLPGGAQRWPSFPSARWAHAAPVRQIQLEQETPERIVVRYVSDRELRDDESAKLSSALQGCLGYPFEMVLERVAGIPRAPGGKFEQFVSKLRT